MTPEQERKILEALNKELLDSLEFEGPQRIVWLVETFFTSSPQVPFNSISGKIDAKDRIHIEVDHQ